jgi:hypothetical protein
MQERGLNVKTLKITALIAILVVICFSVCTEYVQAANEATVTSTLSNISPTPGSSISVTVQVKSNVNQVLDILYLGIHGDWMEEDQFLGANLASNPATLSANGVYSGSFIITIPSSISLGTHTYYIGVDAEDSSANYYSWNSEESVLLVVASSSSTTPTSNPSGNSGQPSDTADYLVYIAIIAIVFMIVLALVVLLTLRKRARARSAQQPTSTPPSQPPVPEKQPPPQEQPSEGENFDI